MFSQSNPSWDTEICSNFKIKNKSEAAIGILWSSRVQVCRMYGRHKDSANPLKQELGAVSTLASPPLHCRPRKHSFDKPVSQFCYQEHHQILLETNQPLPCPYRKLAKCAFEMSVASCKTNLHPLSFRKVAVLPCSFDQITKQWQCL